MLALTHVLGMRAKKRLRFWALHGKMLAFKKHILDCLLASWGLPSAPGLATFKKTLHSKSAAFCVCAVKPTRGGKLVTGVWCGAPQPNL